jgi:hypothetical protein
LFDNQQQNYKIILFFPNIFYLLLYRTHVIFKNDYWGVIDADGNTIISPKYQDIQHKRLIYDGKSEYYLLVKKDDFWGMIDINEQIIVPIKYQNIEVMPNENAIVGIEGHKQFYNFKTKTLLAEPIFDKFYWFSEHYSRVSYGDKESLVENKNNFKMLFPYMYQDISTYDGGFVVTENGKKGLVDIINDIKIPIIYDEMYITCKNKVVAKRDDKFGILSLDNKQLIPFENDQIIGYSERIEIYTDSYQNKVIYDCDLHCIENCSGNR